MKIILWPVSLIVALNVGCGWFSENEQVTYQYSTVKVRNEQFIVSFAEGGQLEAVNKVKVETEMDGSSTIVSVVDEGTYVKGPRQVEAKAGDTPESLAKANGVSVEALQHVNENLQEAIDGEQTVMIPGDLLVELDADDLKDKILNQEISVRTARNAVTKAEGDLEIQRLRTGQSIEDAERVLRFAKLDMEKFLKSEDKITRQTFVNDLQYLSNRVSISEEKLVFQRELAERKFLANMALREEENNAFKLRADIQKLQSEVGAYEKYVYPKTEQDLNSTINRAKLDLTTEKKTATNSLLTAVEGLTTAKQKYGFEQEKLAEVKDQQNKSKIYAPANGLVVYHVGESSRYGGSSGIIEKGTTLRKGQDILQLPDLSQMMVALKVHESRFQSVRGRKQYRTRATDTVEGIAARNNVTERSLRRLNENPNANEKLEDKIARSEEITIPGMFVQVMIDGYDRSFEGEVSYIAPVAAQAERWGSNKKVHKCQVAITEPLPASVRPGATANCRIFIANLPRQYEVIENGEKVARKTLQVPIQSVVTTAAGKKVCYRMNAKGMPEPVLVETGYYDETHIQILDKTKGGLNVDDTILKAPLLHAKELNMKGGHFGYRTLNPEDLGLQNVALTTNFESDKPETVQKSRPPSSTAKAGGGRPSGAQQSGGRPSGGRPSGGRPSGGRPSGGGFGQSSGPPEELKLTDDQKTKWNAAREKRSTAMRSLFTSGIPREEMRSKMTELQSTYEKELNGFLTAEQKKKYQEIQSQRGQGSASRPGGGSSKGGGSGRRSMISRYDTDGDGKVSKEEYGAISGQARQLLGQFSDMDSNGDGFIDKDEEAEATRKMMERFQKGGFGSGGQ